MQTMQIAHTPREALNLSSVSATQSTAHAICRRFR